MPQPQQIVTKSNKMPLPPVEVIEFQSQLKANVDEQYDALIESGKDQLAQCLRFMLLRDTLTREETAKAMGCGLTTLQKWIIGWRNSGDYDNARMVLNMLKEEAVHSMVSRVQNYAPQIIMEALNISLHGESERRRLEAMALLPKLIETLQSSLFKQHANPDAQEMEYIDDWKKSGVDSEMPRV